MDKQLKREDNESAPILVTRCLPIETAIVATAMALTVLVMPSEQHAAASVNEAMLFGFAGFMLFFTSKLSLFVRGVWCSFGPSLMGFPYKLTYFAGYLMMAVSTLRLF